MNPKNFILFLILLFFLYSTLFSGVVEIKTGKPVLTVGDGDLLFEYILAVAEGKNGRLYVLDGRAHKIYILASNGKLEKSFGQKGKGPGDIYNPYDMKYLPSNQIIITEWMNTISVFSKEGKIIKRIELNSKGGIFRRISTLSQNRFICSKRNSDGSQRPIIVNEKGEIIKTLEFYSPSATISIKEGGKTMNFSMYNHAYSPDLPMATFNEFVVVGYTREYKIGVFNSEGKKLGELKRSIKPQSFKKKEIAHIANGVKKLKWPTRVVKLIVKAIPKNKNFFNRILMTKNHILVFRVPDDITSESNLYKVDVFTAKGKFLGTGVLSERVVSITNEFLYFLKTDEDDNLLLIKKPYKIISKQDSFTK